MNYKTIAVINEAHNIFLVQNTDTNKIYVKKTLDIYNFRIYAWLRQNQIRGIPRIIAMREENDQLIVIEEFISGTSLQELMISGQLSPASVAQYMCELCDILGYLHSQTPPIIHRDIKPSNIIITSCGHVVLIDFNAAKYLTDAGASDTVLLGTKGYAAPEQYGFGSSTPQTDIYALGILLQELSSSLPLPTDIFNEIIRKCIQIDPANRFDTVAALKRAILNPTGGSSPAPVTAQSTRFTWKSLLPPGFRTLTPWKMVVAITSYLFLFSLSLTLEPKGVTGPAIWLERIFCLLIFLSIIFCSFNYCGIQRFLPLCNCKNKLLHFISIFLLDFIICFLLFTIMMLLEDFLFA